jgi:rsbT antagonist protein RsbS
VDIPLLKQGRLLIASVQADITDADFDSFTLKLMEELGKYRIRGVIIDVTHLDMVDSYGARTLRDLALMAKIRGAQLVVVGVQPDVALTMVQLGLTLEGVTTALDLEEGIELLKDQVAAS